jgi:hypothetical protein
MMEFFERLVINGKSSVKSMLPVRSFDKLRTGPSVVEGLPRDFSISC